MAYLDAKATDDAELHALKSEYDADVIAAIITDEWSAMGSDYAMHHEISRRVIDRIKAEAHKITTETDRTSSVSGWRKACGYDVYVEDGHVLRGVDGGRTVYPYKANRRGGWDKGDPTIDTLRAGLRRGSGG